MKTYLSHFIKVCAVVVTITNLQAAYAADYVVIVNKDNANSPDKEFITKVYKGEAKSWKDGSSVVAYDLPEESPVREAFLAGVVGKSAQQFRAMWASLTFSGKALPPKSVASDAEVVTAVAANKNAIGYVSSAPANGAIKVIAK